MGLTPPIGMGRLKPAYQRPCMYGCTATVPHLGRRCGRIVL
jgi:hypothetical protein